MKDHIEQLDNILQSNQRPLLKGKGKISHKQAIEKAKEEYKKFQASSITPVEMDYMDTIKKLNKNSKTNSRK